MAMFIRRRNSLYSISSEQPDNSKQCEVISQMKSDDTYAMTILGLSELITLTKDALDVRHLYLNILLTLTPFAQHHEVLDWDLGTRSSNADRAAILDLQCFEEFHKIVLDYNSRYTFRYSNLQILRNVFEKFFADDEFNEESYFSSDDDDDDENDDQGDSEGYYDQTSSQYDGYDEDVTGEYEEDVIEEQ